MRPIKRLLYTEIVKSGAIRLASGILLALMRKVTLNFLVDEWETIDPTPDLHALFLEFNQQFFWGRLVR